MSISDSLDSDACDQLQLGAGTEIIMPHYGPGTQSIELRISFQTGAQRGVSTAVKFRFCY
jgi:hypothetical protein